MKQSHDTVAAARAIWTPSVRFRQTSDMQHAERRHIGRDSPSRAPCKFLCSLNQILNPESNLESCRLGKCGKLDRSRPQDIVTPFRERSGYFYEIQIGDMATEKIAHDLLLSPDMQ